MSVARDSLTRRMRPRRSAASGRRICERIEERWSAGAGLVLALFVSGGGVACLCNEEEEEEEEEVKGMICGIVFDG